MDLLDRLLGGASLQATYAPDHDFWYQPVGVRTAAGPSVDADTAQKISAWYRGRDILATVLAMLPLPLLERLPNDGGAEHARAHPLYDVLHDRPNPWQDSFQWRRQHMYHLVDHGNAYDRIVPGPRGFADQLHPIHPTRVTVDQVDSGRLVYRVRSAKTGLTATYGQDTIFHLRGASSDGVVGVGILEAARTSLGTALATESYAATIFSQGTLNGGVIENPGLLNAEAAQRMAASFVTQAGAWHRPKVLEQGSKWVPNDLTPEDAQMLLSRKFAIDDMARWLGVPRQMLENSDPSFGNAEQFDRNFIAYSLGPWLSLFEFAIRDQLILNPARYYAEFTREALVRGDLAVRWAAHVNAVNAGIKSVDEVRGVENLNKRGGKANDLREPQNITGKPLVSTENPVPGGDDRGARAEAVTIAAAARVLRKEIAAVQKAAVKYAADGAAFTAWVTEFYRGHATLVTQALQVDDAAAARYCAGQARQITPGGGWVDALARWRTEDYAQGLAALLLDGGA